MHQKFKSVAGVLFTGSLFVCLQHPHALMDEELLQVSVLCCFICCKFHCVAFFVVYIFFCYDQMKKKRNGCWCVAEMIEILNAQ